MMDVDDPRVLKAAVALLQGKTHTQAAKSAGVARQTLKRLFAESGMAMPIRRRVRVPEGMDWRFTMVASNGGSVRSHAIPMGLSKNCVYERMKAAGTPVRKLKEEWWRKNEAAVDALVAKGRSVNSACIELGIKPATFYRRKSRKGGS